MESQRGAVRQAGDPSIKGLLVGISVGSMLVSITEGVAGREFGAIATGAVMAIGLFAALAALRRWPHLRPSRWTMVLLVFVAGTLLASATKVAINFIQGDYTIG
jgi:uncharacterized membrane protein YoaK (UPF0700 family)